MDKEQVCGLGEMAMKTETTLIVIIIIYDTIICLRTGISFYSWFDKTQLRRVCGYVLGMEVIGARYLEVTWRYEVREAL